jgi:hypothetical protein
MTGGADVSLQLPHPDPFRDPDNVDRKGDVLQPGGADVCGDDAVENTLDGLREHAGDDERNQNRNHERYCQQRDKHCISLRFAIEAVARTALNARISGTARRRLTVDALQI